MRLAAVCRVLNEEDIIEAFVRHTLAHVDALLILDNGSSDRTLDILRALKAEGLRLTLAQVRTPIFHELQHNSFIHGVAVKAFSPDWVLELDADEFIDTRAADLRTQLAAIRPEMQAVRLPMFDYFSRGPVVTDLLVPRRMVLRDLIDRGNRKIVLRGDLQGEVAVDAGNHGAWVDGQPVLAVDVDALRLAHFPVRDPVQAVVKAALGRLKVMAAGGGPELVAQRASHYTHLLEALCRDPAALFADQARMAMELPAKPLVNDPIRYAGGELRHTVPGHPVMQAIRSVANAMAMLAASHGALLDHDPAARERVEAMAMGVELLFV